MEISSVLPVVTQIQVAGDMKADDETEEETPYCFDIVPLDPYDDFTVVDSSNQCKKQKGDEDKTIYEAP